MSEPLTLEMFEDASETVSKITEETKLFSSEYFTELTGNRVYFKPENMQVTGSFKIRGAYNRISEMSKEERKKGLITASAGNHAVAVAAAARALKAKATVYMPAVTPLMKVKSVRGSGAEVVLTGNDYEECYEAAQKAAEEQGLTYIHPYEDPLVIAGCGSIAMEIIKELPTVDCILVPVGGGALLAGISALARMLNPKICVIGVEPAGADSMAQSLRAGHPVCLEKTNTIADGVNVRRPGDLAFETVREYADRIITVEDEELIVAFLDMVENHKIVVENAGLLTVAALRHLEPENKKVVAVLSGGGMDVITMASIVQHGLIQRDRIFTVSVLLPDKPGELVNVATVIAKHQGNVIKLEHNQFVSINRNAAVELRITIEGFGTEHKREIVRALEEGGYLPKLVPLQGSFL